MSAIKRYGGILRVAPAIAFIPAIPSSFYSRSI
jgi:hypothetical protein